MARPRAFTLVELLVVIGIIAVLIGILLPVLGRAREAGNTAKCLSNMRSLAIAQQMYANDNRGWLVQAGMGHAGSAGMDERLSWFTTLQSYSSTKLLARCPSDHSPFWDGETNKVEVVDLEGNQGRVQRGRSTSYGINVFLDKDLCPWGIGRDPSKVPPGGLYTKMTRVRIPSRIVQFVEIARTGEYATTDHAHVDAWDKPPAAYAEAAKNCAIGAHDSKVKPSWESRANYSFLDGHAETLRFRDVFQSDLVNQFDPGLNY